MTTKKLLSREEVSITGEIEYIINRAQKFDSRVVSLGHFIFFSTNTGDAWMLDPKDGLAICLAQNCEPQPVNILESDMRVGLEWTATYQIEGTAFIVRKNSGQIQTILGYPTKAILDAT